MRNILTILFSIVAMPLWALTMDAPFENIDGGTFRLSDWKGQPLLVVNTASQCGFTDQYADLQELYETYRDKGLVVIAVPSDDFRQELSSNEAVKEFCEVQFGLDMPMTGITHVKGTQAHPFYASVRKEAGFTPRWNFNKILVGPQGDVVATFGSAVGPMSGALRRQIETLLD